MREKLVGKCRSNFFFYTCDITSTVLYSNEPYRSLCEISTSIK